MKIILFLILSISANQALGYDNESPENNTVESIVIDKDYMDGWKLTEDEYKRFKYLKNNTPRGYYTPENPLIYLGLEAKTKEERDKFAMKVAQLEWENQEKVKLFQLAWQEAFVILYGQGDVIDIKSADKFKEHLASLDEQYNGSFNPKSKNTLIPSKTLYVNSNCDKCESTYKEVLKELLNGDIAKLQIAFNSNLNDLDIKKLATKMGVPLNLNESGLIILRKQEANENIHTYPSVTTSKF
jgi:integrating conjugative element protein (TIGR03759 family)